MSSEPSRQATPQPGPEPKFLPIRPSWYPLAFTRDLVEDPHRITIHDQGFVVFRTEGRWQALIDRCPHRSARLSDGQMREGRLECLYHGWQFDGSGTCVHIPQLLTSQKIPTKAHVASFPVQESQGILWLCPEAVNKPSLPDPPTSRAETIAEALPTLPALDRQACATIDFMIDLPYEQSFLIENVIDIAHIHVAHHGVRGGGHREMAAPLEFEVSEREATGFAASFRSVDLDLGHASEALRGARVSFVAPNLVHYESLYEDPELCSGLALYSLPLGRNRCRLLYRAYSNFQTLRDRLRPRWLEHWTQCTILEQDMAVVQGQVEEILGSGRPPRDLWLPLKSSDALVIAYRKWIDEYGSQAITGEAHAVGFSKMPPAESQRADPTPFDRLRMHTEICSSCSQARERLLAARPFLNVGAFALLVAAALGGGIPAALLALGAGLGRLGVDLLERGFRST